MKYHKEIERLMKDLHANLSEKDKRHYAAIEAVKLPHGGIKYMSNLFNCSRQTIYRGITELKKGRLLEIGKLRNKGGGRKSYITENLNVDDIFFKGNRRAYSW